MIAVNMARRCGKRIKTRRNGRKTCPQCPKMEVLMIEVDGKSFTRVTDELFAILEINGEKTLPQQKQLHRYTIAKELQRSMTLPAGSEPERVTVKKVVESFQGLVDLKNRYPHRLPFHGGSEKQFWGSRDKYNITVLVLM
jgi:hypothetical protein